MPDSTAMPATGTSAAGGLPARAGHGFSLAMLSAFLLAFTAIIIRVLTEQYRLPALVLAFWRAALVAAVLFPVLLCVRPQWLRLGWARLRFYALFGLVLALFNALWTFSIMLNGASVATILSYFSVVAASLKKKVCFGEHLNARQLAVIGISLIGCALVSLGGHSETAHTGLFGLLIGVLTGVGSTLYALCGRLASRRGYPEWNTILYVFAFAALYQLLFNALAGHLPVPDGSLTGSVWFLSQGEAGIQWHGWGLLLLLAAGPTLLGFGLYNLSLKTLPLAVANLVLSLELVFTAAIAFVLLGETLTPWQLLGSTLMLAGVGLMRRRTQGVKGKVVRGQHASPDAATACASAAPGTPPAA